MGRVDPDELDRLVTSPRQGVLLDKAAVADLVAELRASRDKLDAIQRLLRSSPIGPTRAQAVATLFEIRLVATNEFDRHVQHLDDPGSERDGE